MRKYLLLFILINSLCTSAFSQNYIWNETEEAKYERLQWWTDARFGMFIHWGIYSHVDRDDKVKKNERISDANYQKYCELVNSDVYNPAEWAKKAKARGMKYAVITYKH